MAKHRTSPPGMWLMWTVIGLLVASIVLGFIDIFFEGSTMMWASGACGVAAILCAAAGVKLGAFNR